MTVTAVSPKAGKVAPGRPPAGYPIQPGQSGIARAAAGRGNDPHAAPAPPRSRRLTPLTPMRQQAAKSMRRLAEGIARDHPELAVHDHVRDAARTLESGNEEASQRHLRAAMFSLTPQSLMRNGVHDDIGHISARQAVHGVHRHLLLVKDIADVAAKNQAAIRRDSYGGYESGPTLPRADPNAGYGPGALAQKPQARQPGGDRALNAPDRTNSGGSDPAVADPVGVQPRGSKQFARTWGELAAAVELVGPHGYEHGWIKADPGTGILTGSHPADRLTVAADPKREARAMSDSDLRAAHTELARRAAMLGKPGQLSRGHKAVVAERKRRAAAPKTKGSSKQFARTWSELADVIDLAWIASPSKAEWAAIDAKSGRSMPDAKDGSDEDKASSHIQAAKQATQIGQHAVAIKHLARASALTSDPAKQAAVNTLRGAVAKNAQLRGQSQQLVGLAASWDDLAGVIGLSARTAQLEVTPAPRGKPGGPGLYDVAGMGHTHYEQQIVKALIEKRGMPPGRAYAIARGAIRRWARGGGKVHPEVRAAAGAAEAGELAKQARAKAVHGHASGWDDAGAVIELISTAENQTKAQGQPRDVTGKFSTSQAAQQAAAKKAAAARPGAKKPAAKGKPAPAKPAAKKQTPVQQQAALMNTAKADHAKAQGIIRQIIAAQAQVKSLQAASAKSTAANNAATAATGQTASTSNVTASSAPAAASTASTPGSSTSSTSSSTPAPTVASLTKQITTWQGQVKTLLGQAAQASAQAAKL